MLKKNVLKKFKFHHESYRLYMKKVIFLSNNKNKNIKALKVVFRFGNKYATETLAYTSPLVDRIHELTFSDF